MRVGCLSQPSNCEYKPEDYVDGTEIRQYQHHRRVHGRREPPLAPIIIRIKQGGRIHIIVRFRLVQEASKHHLHLSIKLMGGWNWIVDISTLIFSSRLEFRLPVQALWPA